MSIIPNEVSYTHSYHLHDDLLQSCLEGIEIDIMINQVYFYLQKYVTQGIFSPINYSAPHPQELSTITVCFQSSSLNHFRIKCSTAT